MLTIGVLGLQGAVREHIHAIEACGAAGLVVKRPEQLNEIDGLILPGGESTTMRRLIDTYQSWSRFVNLLLRENRCSGHALD